MQESYRIPNGKITRKTGTEGPTYDPYSYEEWVVERRGQTVRLHIGLGFWFEDTKGDRYVPVYTTLEQDRVVEGKVMSRFENFVGCSYQTLNRAIDRLRSTCKKCGGHLVSEEGYPGETLYVCPNCHLINGGSFNINDVI